MSKVVNLRAITPDDEAFLVRLYGSTRPEVSMLGWNENEQYAFFKMQLEMQTRSHLMHRPDAEYSIILLNSDPVGRLVVERDPSRISLVDIAVAPEFRGNGIAKTVIDQLQDDATSSDQPIELSVDKTNAPALQLYGKSGFEITGETDLAFKMRWTPNPQK
jgi:ribosomal protein S18 acetylase RimI-like enzyme